MRSQQVAQWRVQSASLRETLGVSAEYSPWSQTARLLGIPRGERARDLLDIAYIDRMSKVRPGTSTQEALRGFWADSSQAVARRPWGLSCACMTTESVHYSFSHDFALSGYDQLRLQGYHIGSAPRSGSWALSNAQLKNLAGEAFCAPVAAMVCYAYWLNPQGVWWQAD